jgi:hypothetical protein
VDTVPCYSRLRVPRGHCTSHLDGIVERKRDIGNIVMLLKGHGVAHATSREVAGSIPNVEPF